MKKMPTKSESMQQFSGGKFSDPILGETALSELPEKLFQTVVEGHNRKLESIIEKTPQDRYHLRSKLYSLRIPSFREFLEILSNRNQKASVDAHLRRGNFENYKKWLKNKHEFVWTAFLNRTFPFHLAPNNQHTYLIGKTGSGKSELIKLLCMLSQEQGSQKRCRIIIDPAGDLALEIAKQKYFRANASLVYIDPFLDGSRTERFPCFNPFDPCGRKLSDNRTATLAEQLCGVFVSILRGDVSLSLQMETLLIPCLTVLIERPHSTLFDLLRFMNEKENADLVALGKQSRNPAHQLFFANLFHSRNFSPTKISIATKTQSLLNNRIFAGLIARPQSTLDLHQIIREGKTLVVNCAKGKLGDQTSEAFGRFVVAMVQSIALSRQPSERTPIDLMIDECQNFISGDVKLILTEARKFGLNLILSQQVAGQDMPEKLTKIVLGNTGRQIIGNAGRYSRDTMGKEMNVQAEMMENLKAGQFIVKTGDRAGLKVNIRSDYVKNRNTMSPSGWKRVRAAMLDKYYSTSPVKNQIFDTSSPEAEAKPNEEGVQPPPGKQHSTSYPPPLPKPENHQKREKEKQPGNGNANPETAKPKFDADSDDMFDDL